MDYDHIVIGGGSSGATLAVRLSEDPGRSVLLLEAGPDFPDVSTMPEDLRNARNVSVVKHDWHFHAEAVPGRIIDYARGKVTGGCSAINGAIAFRGIPADYDEWAAVGNPEWSWAKVLPYFNKLEHDQDFAADYHGNSGPLPIVRWKSEELVPLQRAYLETCLEKGFNYVADHNDPTSTGVGPIPMNRVENLRISTAIAYLNPARHRLNLTIRPNCHMDRVIFEGTKAVGVVLESGGQIQRVYGDQITISAGAVCSPGILMRSGIGPKANLEALGIKVVHESPGVGQNLIEHQQVALGILPKEGVSKAGDPDVQIIIRYTAPGTNAFNNMQTYFVSGFVPELALRPISVMSVLQKPKCRGEITITSANPYEHPKVILNSYGHPDDMKIALDGLRLCWDIANSRQIKELSSGSIALTQKIVDDDKALFEYIRAQCATLWHPVGTCKIGPDNNSMAVVDQYCRVRGVENLRIVDASVMPDHVSGNPNLTCIAIAERVADWLKAEK